MLIDKLTDLERKIEANASKSELIADIRALYYDYEIVKEMEMNFGAAPQISRSYAVVMSDANEKLLYKTRNELAVAKITIARLQKYNSDLKKFLFTKTNSSIYDVKCNNKPSCIIC